MTKRIGIVDIFSGPGGLSEGFSAFRNTPENAPYEIAISIEKEASAHATLRLRSFLRKFTSGFPPEYYDFLNGKTEEPDWNSLYPGEWKAAENEVRCLSLGDEGKEGIALLESRIAEIRKHYGNNTMLIGGPPCQAYSLVGRSRNAGIAGYIPHDDERNYLYREYVRVLKNLKPAIFVMENVKGMLSADIKGGRIFKKIMSNLRSSAGKENYRLFALSSTGNKLHTEHDLEPEDFVVRTEKHGIPQARHRVIIIGIRREIASILPDELWPQLSVRKLVSVGDVIGAMPRLRSGLSRGDSNDTWKDEIQDAIILVRKNKQSFPEEKRKKFEHYLDQCALYISKDGNIPRESSFGTGLKKHCPDDLREWLIDDELDQLSNNTTRGHMPSDLARYLFASIFSKIHKKSPKSSEFPKALSPNHKKLENWKFFRQIQSASIRSTIINSNQSYFQGWTLFYTPRSEAMSQLDGSRSCSPSDFSG